MPALWRALTSSFCSAQKMLHKQESSEHDFPIRKTVRCFFCFGLPYFIPCILRAALQKCLERLRFRIIRPKGIYGNGFHFLLFHRTVGVVGIYGCDFIYHIHALCNFAESRIGTV